MYVCCCYHVCVWGAILFYFNVCLMIIILEGFGARLSEERIMKALHGTRSTPELT
jgi:hypothetical protein